MSTASPAAGWSRRWRRTCCRASRSGSLAFDRPGYGGSDPLPVPGLRADRREPARRRSTARARPPGPVRHLGRRTLRPGAGRPGAAAVPPPRVAERRGAATAWRRRAVPPPGCRGWPRGPRLAAALLRAVRPRPPGRGSPPPCCGRSTCSCAAMSATRSCGARSCGRCGPRWARASRRVRTGVLDDMAALTRPWGPAGHSRPGCPVLVLHGRAGLDRPARPMPSATGRPSPRRRC